MAEPRVVKPRSASGKQQKQALRRPASGEGAQAQRGRSGSAAVQSTQQGWRAERPEPGRCECRAGGVSGEEGDGDTGECQGALQNVLPSVFCLYLSRFLSRFRSRFVSLSFLSRGVLVAACGGVVRQGSALHGAGGLPCFSLLLILCIKFEPSVLHFSFLFFAWFSCGLFFHPILIWNFLFQLF